MVDGPTYQRQHYRVIRDRGYAHRHRCIDCGEPALDWSHRHDTDPSLIESYDPRCRSCHIKYDFPLGRNVKRTLSEEDVIEIRRRHAEYGWNYRELSEIYGVTAVSIGEIVRRKTWKHLT